MRLYTLLRAAQRHSCRRLVSARQVSRSPIAGPFRKSRRGLQECRRYKGRRMNQNEQDIFLEGPQVESAVDVQHLAG
jgi:hypothetical protein